MASTSAPRVGVEDRRSKEFHPIIRDARFNPFVKLSGMSEALCGTEPRLVLPHAVTLRLRTGAYFWPGNRFQITCADTGTNYFRCQEKLTLLSGKRILWDLAGTPVLNLKRDYNLGPFIFSLTSTWIVYAGSNSGKMLFKLNVKHGLGTARVTADFPDVCSGRMRHIVMKWNEWKKMGVVYSGEPKQKGVVKIAKLYDCPFSTSYFLEIAPEVDIALIISMCIAAVERSL